MTALESMRESNNHYGMHRSGKRRGSFYGTLACVPGMELALVSANTCYEGELKFMDNYVIPLKEKLKKDELSPRQYDLLANLKCLYRKCIKV
jgi:hypothetical protein